MKSIKTKKTLKQIKASSFGLLIIAVSFIAFGDFYLIGVVLVLSALLIEWKFYRCPHCNRSLDPRMPLNIDTHCPNCGKKI